jgi:autotransporter-associated beta strand protein
VVGDVAFNGLEFQTSGYTLSGSAGVLTTTTANSAITLGSNVTATIDTRIAGSGGISVQGSGTLILGGDNTYTGGTAIGSGSTLQVGNGGTSGSIVGNVANDGTLVFKRADTITFGGEVSGTGALRQDGSGTLILTGNNTYTGGTTIASGSTLQIGNGGTTGAIVGNVVNDGALIFNRADTIAFGGAISGGGKLTQEGNGTLVLSGANSYSGGTSVQSGTVSISSDDNLGSGNLLLDGGTLQTTATFASNRRTTLGGRGGTFNTNSGTNFTFGGTLDGAGALTKIGGGTLTLSGVNTYSGGTRLNAGTVSISSDSNLGALSGGVTFNGGTLQTTADLTSSRAMTLEGAGTFETANGSTFHVRSGISGAGALNKSGDGRLILSAANAYTGGTNVLSGALQLGDCGTTGSIVGDVRVDGALVVSRSDGFTFGGAVSGGGSVVKDCSGTTILSGINTYTGGTQINAGTLQGDSRSLQGEIVNNSSLIFDQASDGAFSGTLFGLGSMIKRGSGALSLTGNHGMLGSTTIESGALSLDGSIAGAVGVMRDGTFNANGVIGDSLVVEGRVNVVSSASDELGALGVRGDATFRPDSVYGVTLNAAGGNSALVASGHAGIQGARITVNAEPGDYARVTQYAVMLGDGGLSGVASASSSSPLLEPVLSKNDTTLFVTLLNREIPLTRFAISSNGSRVASALDRLKGNASGDLAGVTGELIALDDRALALSLDAMSGEIHSSSVQLAAIDGESATDAVRSEVTLRMSQQDAETSGASVWGSNSARNWFRFRGERNSFASSGQQDGLFEVRGGSGSINGFAMGRDWMPSPRWLFGVGGSFATGRMALDGLTDSTTFSSPRGMAYAGYSRRGWAVDGGVAVARASYEIVRNVQFIAFAPGGGRLFGGVDRTAISRPSGVASEVWSEVRVDRRLGSWKLQPAAGIRRARYGLAAYAETGADSMSFSAPARSIASLQADMGLRATRGTGALRPYVGAVVRRELASGRTTAGLHLAGDPNGAFEVDGQRLSKHSTIGQAGVLLRSRGVGLSLMYEARANSEQIRQTFQLGIDFQ